MRKKKETGISKEPVKILEIPGFEDNFYHSVFSVSKTDNIAMVLANCVFVLNQSTGANEKLYQAFDCEEITSVKWDPTGT